MLLHNFCNGEEETSMHPKSPVKILLKIGCIGVEVISHNLGLTLCSISIDVHTTKLWSYSWPLKILIEYYGNNHFQVITVFFLPLRWRVVGDHLCWCQNRQISGRGSRTVRLRIEGNKGRWEHNVYLGSGPLKGGKILCHAWLYSMRIGITRVDLPRDRNG